MREWFSVDHIDIERILSEWRWLCPGRLQLVARTAFGELFLRDETGAIFWLNTTVGKLIWVASSEPEFRELAETKGKRDEWFAEPDVEAVKGRGLNPTRSQCIAFPIPLVFAESGSSNEPYVVDLYECVSFLGDLHRQISSCPDGTTARLHVQPPKSASSRQA